MRKRLKSKKIRGNKKKAAYMPSFSMRLLASLTSSFISSIVPFLTRNDFATLLFFEYWTFFLLALFQFFAARFCASEIGIISPRNFLMKISNCLNHLDLFYCM